MKDRERREISAIETMILGIMFGDDKPKTPKKDDAQPQPKPKRPERKREG
jgi:hypothetical protein